MKNRMVITWVRSEKDIPLGTDSFLCHTLEGAFDILSKRKKVNINRAIWYDKYGRMNDLYRRRQRLWAMPEKMPIDIITPAKKILRFVTYFWYNLWKDIRAIYFFLNKKREISF